MQGTVQKFISVSLLLATYAVIATITAIIIILTGGSLTIAVLLLLPIIGAALFHMVGGVKKLREFDQSNRVLEENLRESRVQHRAVLEHMTEGIILTDIDGRVNYINPYTVHLTGYTLKELEGKGVTDVLVLPAERELMRKRTREATTGRIHQHEMRIQRKNGGMAWLRVSSSPLRDDNNHITGGIHIVNDVTTEKKIQDKLRQSDARLRAVLKNIPIVLFMFDQDGIFTFSDGKSLQAIGLDKHAVIGKSIFDLYAHKPMIVANAQRVLNGETFYTTAQVNERNFETYYSPLYDDEGVLNGAIGVSIDITERTTAEQDLHLHTQAIEFSTTGITIVDARAEDMPLIYMNPAMEDITGYTLDEMLGRNCRFLQSGDRDQSGLLEVRDALKNQHPVTVTLRNYRKDGTQFFNELSIAPVQDENGAVSHFVGIVNDVTERVESERNLETARDQALEASRLKSEFLATMSHEIRTPMNGILGMTELLLDTKLNEEQQEFANIVSHEANHLLQIINDILDFSKIEAGNVHLSKELMNLHDIIENVAESHSVAARRKSIPIMHEIAPDVPVLVNGDALRLRQILTNLMDNAVKFTAEGEITIRSIVDSHTDDQIMVYIAIHDTGIGISSEIRERLFEPFTQADGSTTRRFGGTGLGLTISKRLVELMGGRLGVESMEGVGSTFWITIPFDLTEVDETYTETFEVSDTLAQMRLLIVDDNQTQIEILHRQLDHLGLQHHFVSKPAQVMPTLIKAHRHNKPFHIAVIDNFMPEIDGFTLAETIRKDPRFEELNLLVMSAFDAPPDLKHFMGFIPKPIKRHYLLTTLEKCAGQITDDVLEDVSKPLPNILLVEDNEINRLVAERQLRRLGYQVSTASNGEEALDILQHSDQIFDAVLMDCQMPNIDGYEATQRLRTHEKATDTHLPVIALTANALQGDRERALAAGMDDYITKPVTLNQLQETLTRWIK